MEQMMTALQSAQEMMNRFENLSKRGGAWDGVEADARDARDAAAAYAAIAQAEALTRIAVALEAMRDMRQADAIWGEAAAAEVRADTDSLREGPHVPAMPEPDWSQAPKWAMYHVHDPACVWAWWLEQWPKHPQLLTHMFTGRWMPYENPLPVGIDYRTTLSTRPEANND